MRLSQNIVKLKGFILDLPFDTKDCEFWLSALKSNQIKINKIRNILFSHVVELVNSTESVQFHSDNIYELPENFRLFSAYDREMLKRPKKKVPGEEEKEEDEENVQKPVEIGQLVHRQNESLEITETFLEKLQEFVRVNLSSLKHCEHIKIKNSLGFSPENLVSTVVSLVKPELVPLPKLLEAGSDENLKDLLT